jgi:iron complex outermembrane receptor protein
MTYDSTRLKFAVRRGLTLSALASAGFSGQVLAQQNPDTLDTVIVTGSRIANSATEAPIPVQVYDSEQITQQGAGNLADVLSKIPAVGTAGFSRANSNFATSGNGVSTVNLRNIDDKRTLVLVNGRRVVSGIGGSSTVDLNNIPLDLIDRVEVVTGGASAVYGSEAIAGVVNFILKENFEGMSARVQAGQSSKHDAEQYLASFTFGTRLADRANLTVNLQYDKDEGLRSKNRAISREDIPFRSSYVPQGLFLTTNNDWTYGPDGTLKPEFTNEDGFNRNGERYISVPVERKMASVLGQIELTDTIKVFLEGTYADVQSNSRLEPYAFDNSDAELPDGTVLAGLTTDNPFIPQAILDDMALGGDTILSFRKRANGIFDRSNINERTFYRFVAGLKGSIFDDWDWDVYVNTSETIEDTRSETGLRDRLYYALDAVTGVSGPECRDAAARAAGCQPLNVFGFNSASAASIAYIRDGRFDTYKATVNQKVVAANITGPIMELKAGDLQLAAGAEYRKEESSEIYSIDTQAGNTLGNALNNTAGDYSVSEAYLEALVPLLADMPGVELLEAQAAVRMGDYSSVGEILSWKAGLVWAPIDEVRVRAVYANATRAPNIGELYQGQNQDFPSGITDPCDGVDGATTGAVADYCRSIPGIAQQIGANGAFIYDNNTDRQSIEAFDQGNVNVGEENAKTLTVGVVLTPIPTLSLSLDWFRIRVTDAIRTVPVQYAIDTCVNSLGASELCSTIVREEVGTPRPRTPGTVYQVYTDYRNLSAIESSGVDASLRYSVPVSVLNLDLALNYTYLDKLTIQPFPGEKPQSNVGQLNGDDRLGAGFRRRANLSATLSKGGASATWRVNYLSSIQDTLDENDPILEPRYNNINSIAYHDLYFKYEFGTTQTFAVYAGVNNFLDVKPPLIDQNGASNITGTETAAESYDPIGRYLFAGVSWKM